MLSDQADQATKTGHPRLWVAGLVLLLTVAALLVTVNGDDSSTVIPPERDRSPSSSPDSSREAKATTLLAAMTRALIGGTRKDAVNLALPGDKAAARTIGFIYDNVQAIRFSELSLRYVDEAEDEVSPADNTALADDRWVADVQVGWQIDGFDAELSQIEVAFVLAETDQRAAFVSAGEEYGDRAPLWLLTDLATERSQRALVLVAQKSSAGRFMRLASRAVVQVRRVLPGWRGKLVIEVPGSQHQLNRMLAADANTYTAIAAVTSTVGGSGSRSSPAHIFVNPRVFGRLGSDGAQIVMSHEATHVATDAATSSMPMWLLEGFADYVALAHVDLPVSATASQILADVRRSGPPKALPGKKEFDPKNAKLGATYEAAWLAARYLADEFGEATLVAFYQSVDSGTRASLAFRRILDTTERRFVRGWRNYLRRLAS